MIIRRKSLEKIKEHEANSLWEIPFKKSLLYPHRYLEKISLHILDYYSKGPWKKSFKNRKIGKISLKIKDNTCKGLRKKSTILGSME